MSSALTGAFLASVPSPGPNNNHPPQTTSLEPPTLSGVPRVGNVHLHTHVPAGNLLLSRANVSTPMAVHAPAMNGVVPNFPLGNGSIGNGTGSGPLGNGTGSGALESFGAGDKVAKHRVHDTHIQNFRNYVTELLAEGEQFQTENEDMRQKVEVCAKTILESWNNMSGLLFVSWLVMMICSSVSCGGCRPFVENLSLVMVHHNFLIKKVAYYKNELVYANRDRLRMFWDHCSEVMMAHCFSVWKHSMQDSRVGRVHNVLAERTR